MKYILWLLALVLLSSSALAIDLNDGVIMWLPYDTNTKENITGTAPYTGTASLITNANRCYSGGGCLNVSNNYLKYARDANFNITNTNNTICGWSNKTSTDHGAILSYGQLEGSPFSNHSLKLYQGAVSHFDIRNRSNEIQTTPSVSVNLNQWEYACGRFAYDTQNITYWRNGSMESTGIQHDPDPEAHVYLNMSVMKPYVMIGGYNATSGANDHMYFDGFLDNIIVYDRTLSDAEMLELFIAGGDPNGTPANFTIRIHDNTSSDDLYNWTATIYGKAYTSNPSFNKSIRMLNQTVTIILSKAGYASRTLTDWDVGGADRNITTWLTASGGGGGDDDRTPCGFGATPMNYYSFNTDATDGAGSNDGTVNGVAHVTETGCKFSGCYNLTAGNDITFDNDLNNAKTAFTIGVWFYGMAAGSHGAMVSVGYVGTYGYNFYANSATTMVQSQLYDGSDYEPNYADGSGAAAAWEHWVFSYDNVTKVATTYKNGAVANNITRANPFVSSSMAFDTMYVGAYKGTVASAYWDDLTGYVDDVVIYPVALTAPQIRDSLYNSGDSCAPVSVASSTVWEVSNQLGVTGIRITTATLNFTANMTLNSSYLQLYESDCSTYLSNWTNSSLTANPFFYPNSLDANTTYCGKGYGNYNGGINSTDFFNFTTDAPWSVSTQLDSASVNQTYMIIDFIASTVLTSSWLQVYESDCAVYLGNWTNATDTANPIFYVNSLSADTTYCLKGWGLNQSVENSTDFQNFTTLNYRWYVSTGLASDGSALTRTEAQLYFTASQTLSSSYIHIYAPDCTTLYQNISNSTSTTNPTFYIPTLAPDSTYCSKAYGLYQSVLNNTITYLFNTLSQTSGSSGSSGATGDPNAELDPEESQYYTAHAGDAEPVEESEGMSNSDQIMYGIIALAVVLMIGGSTNAKRKREYDD